MTVSIARVYDAPGDGRVLVDRLWPRGIRKDDPRIGRWIKEAAPSKELRTWYHANMDQYDAFHTRYLAELETPGPAADALNELVELARAGDLELATAMKDPAHSEVPTLVEAIEAKLANA
ncbi:DUF488 domain-containing protein [Gordonia phthalatica]|uniref:MarR family transcriptional regulator n=1 Tax=Gordonia phthalatica TaxID=1136941 RepID=A0A0N9MSK4_9ACTN|nr:DUF488 family protein [Gordonia phthalatica]ALG85505.1 hypothetical protein ACH46_14795 [Gordonia phthalatica]